MRGSSGASRALGRWTSLASFPGTTATATTFGRETVGRETVRLSVNCTIPTSKKNTHLPQSHHVLRSLHKTVPGPGK